MKNSLLFLLLSILSCSCGIFSHTERERPDVCKEAMLPDFNVYKAEGTAIGFVTNLDAIDEESMDNARTKIIAQIETFGKRIATKYEDRLSDTKEITAYRTKIERANLLFAKEFLPDNYVTCHKAYQKGDKITIINVVECKKESVKNLYIKSLRKELGISEQRLRELMREIENEANNSKSERSGEGDSVDAKNLNISIKNKEKVSKCIKRGMSNKEIIEIIEITEEQVESIRKEMK